MSSPQNLQLSRVLRPLGLDVARLSHRGGLQLNGPVVQTLPERRLAMPDLSQHGPVVLQVQVPLLAAVHEASAPQQGLRLEVGTGDGQVVTPQARGCDYKTAQKIVFRIFKDYYHMDLQAEDQVQNQVSEEASRLTYMVRFPGV